MGKVIAIANHKGGVGKTTTAIEVAACLSNKSYNVILLDIDPQADASRSLNIDTKNSIYDLLTQKIKVHKSLHKTKWFTLIPGSQQMSNAVKVFTDPSDIYLLNDLCEVLIEEYEYDFVIIDAPPMKDITVNMMYVAADYIISPTACDDNSIEAIISIEKDLRKMRESKHPLSHAHIIGMILTNYEKNTRACTYALEQLHDLAKGISKNTFVSTIKKCIKMSEIKHAYMPLQEYAKWDDAAIDYRRITDNILELIR